MSHWVLVDELAAANGVPENTRRMWKERGVPFRVHHIIIEEARKRGLEIDQDMLRAKLHTPKKRQPATADAANTQDPAQESAT